MRFSFETKKMTSTASRSETDDARWFFKEIDSKAASNILNSAGAQVGTFLVRESCSSRGNFVLSFVAEDGHADILICNYWQDSFYSLITDPEKIFHGLDTLIDYYCENSVTGQSGVKLTFPCPGDPPPPETRLHGTSNLLHRAVSQGNMTVVSELLKSGYRKLDAKNYHGQTALHIACINGNEEIVKLLLDANANSNVRDQEGLTPLQLACRYDFASVVDLLISEGGAKLQLRTPLTAEVALHEAASCGSIDSIRVLLRHHAPIWPRATHERTPASVAKENNHLQCYSCLVHHRPVIPLTRLPEYYHGRINREEAQRILRADGNSEGQFLLRKGSKEDARFVLSLISADETYHFQIQKRNSMYFIDDGPYFMCLETLIDHYSRFCDGLPCRLTRAVSPRDPLDEAEFKEIYFQDINKNLPGPETYLCMDLKERGLCLSSSAENSGMGDNACNNINGSLQHLTVNDNVANSSSWSQNPSPNLPRYVQAATYRGGPSTAVAPVDDIFGVIEHCNLKIGERLGVGEFGTVHKAVWTNSWGEKIDVAMKTLHDNSSVTKENFFREVNVMIDLNHPFIVKLLGVCHEPPVAMVQELACMGSLLNFLLDFPQQIQPNFHFKLWASQVADGMNYLEQKHFVHRDLAARNLLLCSITCVKISDFGLSRALNANNDYYKATGGGKWPLKWYAPESIYYGQFTHLSDVWSYGVTLWEMFTFGEQPYGELTGHQVADLLEKGQRLPQPKECPEATYKLMLRCWHLTPRCRPTFRDLVVIFRGSKDYVNVKPYIKK